MIHDDTARGEAISRSGKYAPAAELNGWTNHIPPPDEPPDDDPYRDTAHEASDDRRPVRWRRADDVGTHRPRPVAERRN